MMRTRTLQLVRSSLPRRVTAVPRRYASHGPSPTRKSSDLYWQIGSVAFFGPLIIYLTSPPSGGHDHDHDEGDHRLKVRQMSRTPAEEPEEPEEEKSDDKESEDDDSKNEEDKERASGSKEPEKVKKGEDTGNPAAVDDERKAEKGEPMKDT